MDQPIELHSMVHQQSPVHLEFINDLIFNLQMIEMNSYVHVNDSPNDHEKVEY